MAKRVYLLSLLLVSGSIFARAANSVQWINPSSGAAMTSGQPVEATWTSDRPIPNPLFSWCTAEAVCGQPIQPDIIDNEDGTTSAQLTPPQLDSTMGVFLQMSDKDGGGIHQSPSFTFESASSGDVAPIKAVEAAQSDPAHGAEAEPTNPYKWDNEATPTDGLSDPNSPNVADRQRQMDPSAVAAAMSAAYGQAQPTAYPSQQPFTNPYAVMNMSTSALAPPAVAASENHQDRGRPSAAVIAVPLSICGVILLASLIFCVRTRYSRKSKADLETAGAGTLPPMDWQAIVKRKAMEASVEKGSQGGGVTVIERRDDAVLPTLGYSQGVNRSGRGARYDDAPRYQARRGYGEEDDPRSSRGGGRTFAERRMHEREDSRDRSSISSRSGTRCITPLPSRERSYDDRYTAASMLDVHGSRSKKRYAYDNHRSNHSRSRDWDEFDDRHSVKDGYYKPTRRSRSGLDGVGDHCDCSSRHSVPHSHSLRSAHGSNSSPGSRDCHDCPRPSVSGHAHSTSHLQSRSSSIDPFADLPGPTYSAPSHEPMIRVHTSSTLSRSYREPEYMNKNQPRRSRPVIRRGDSSTSTITEAGWDLAGKGAYETHHDRGMGELYESLKRAIGESEKSDRRV